ncbi:MAG: hypothetical protein JW395_0178 [Nitrospira sp.]|nr:hypothetical protein [Nitrospira sp.]
MARFGRWCRYIAALIIALLISFSTVEGADQKTVHVKGYHKKDGTYVEGYDRKAPAPKGDNATTKGDKPATKGNKAAKSAPPPATTASPQPRDEKGRFVRSGSAKNAFMKKSGYPKGRPGYVVDHIVPLACGGADGPSNMQGQTVAEGKAKDKVERKGCR